MKLAAPSAALLLATACSSMTIEGDVVDATGQPMPGVLVSAVGHPCQTSTDEAGHFALSCTPAEHTIAITQQQHVSVELEIEALEKTAYPTGQHTLVRIPDGQGLFLFADNQYVPMTRGLVERRITKGTPGAPLQKSYCLLPEQEPQLAQSVEGKVEFFDNNAEEWRAWRADPEGCIYRLDRDHERFEVSWGDRPERHQQMLSDDQELVTLTMQPGDYFFADWPTGFFSKAPKDQQLEDADTRFTGFYLRVE